MNYGIPYSPTCNVLGSHTITERNMSNPIMQFFKYEHLPEKLQVVSKPFCTLAEELDRTLPQNPETSTALRKMVEAKDCAVRAILFQP